MVASRGRGESWRAAVLRAWPLAAAVVAYLVIAWSVLHTRGEAHERLGVTPAAIAAAFAHLFQVIAGIEWYSTAAGQIRPVVAWVVALALALFAVAATARNPRPAAGERETGNGRGIVTGVTWALAGAAVIMGGIFSLFSGMASPFFYFQF